MPTDRLTLAKTLIRSGGSIIDALRAIDEGGLRGAMVVDSEERLIGILTDGDIRRALLSGARLEAAVDDFIQRQPLTVPPSASRADVIDLMRAHFASLVPTLDESGRVVGVHLLNEMIEIGRAHV